MNKKPNETHHYLFDFQERFGNHSTQENRIRYVQQFIPQKKKFD